MKKTLFTLVTCVCVYFLCFGVAFANTVSVGLSATLAGATGVSVVYTEIQIEKGLIKLKGESRSMDEVSKVKTKLSEFLSDVSVSDIKPAAQGKILFTVVAKEK